MDGAPDGVKGILITGEHGDSYRRCCEVRRVASLEEAREAFLHVMNVALLGPLTRATVSQEVVHVRVANWMAHMPSERCWNFVFQPSMTSCRSSVVTICGDALCVVEEVELSTFGTPSRKTTSSPSLWPSLSTCESCDSSCSLIFVYCLFQLCCNPNVFYSKFYERMLNFVFPFLSSVFQNFNCVFLFNFDNMSKM